VVGGFLPTPSGVTEADVLQAFPGAEAVILHKNKQKGEANGWATVTLRTAEAAAGAADGAAWDRGLGVRRMGLPGRECRDWGWNGNIVSVLEVCGG